MLVPLSEVRPWSPDDPHLYDLEVTLGDDRVTSYAGLRSFGVGADAEGRPRFLLNGEPVVHVGVLDQGYWPDGLLTPPSDEAMVHDIESMKSLGFTMLRKHAKVEPLRWYAHCDRLGMLVWQDVVNGGGRYRHLVTTRARHPEVAHPRPAAPALRAPGPVRPGGVPARGPRDRRAAGNVVSLAVWTPFNEGWGQFDANSRRPRGRRRSTRPGRSTTSAAGSTREAATSAASTATCARSGCRDASRGRRGRRVVALSEYGGYSLRVEGHDWSPREFGYRHLEDSDAFDEAFTTLHEPLVAAAQDGLGATVYTQLSDVEDELNGLVTWDREVLKLDADVVRRVTAALRSAIMG